MPWDSDKMKAKGAKRPDVAAKAANDALRRCLAAGGSAKECEAKAIRIGLYASNMAGRKK